MTDSASDLSAFERAFDRSAPAVTLDWDLLQRALRRAAHRPTWNLVWTSSAIVACIAIGALGVPAGWMVALGLVLTTLPQRLRERSQWRDSMRAVEGADDLRALCAQQARRQMAGAFVSALVLTLLAVVFALTAAVAFVVGKTPVPGLVAASVLAVWIGYDVLVSLPRAARDVGVIDGRTPDEHLDGVEESGRA